jgi:hypothetical protein
MPIIGKLRTQVIRADYTGAAGDNATAESFFSPLQKNVLDRQRCETRDEPRMAIVI